MADTSSKQRSRKEPVQTDFAARIVQFQRKAAADTRPRPKGERPNNPSLSKPSESPKEKSFPKDEFSRDKFPSSRDEFSRSMTATAIPPRLFNPNTDPIPLRRTQEPEHISSFISRSPPKGMIARPQRPEPPSSRRLFDPKRDQPIAFSTVSKSESSNETTRPPAIHRSSGDYLSASSTSMSSYPPSLGSSAFTLSTSSSSSSAPFKKEDPNSPVVAQLKRLYRSISSAERKLLEEKPMDLEDEPTRVVLQSRDSIVEPVDPWLRLLADHKELAELMHNFLTLTLSPQVPVSFHGIANSCNIPSRLWTNAFHRLLETLRRASLTSSVALEHLSDFIYHAYNFYAGLHENPILDAFRLQWLEALGDLARYRMAVAAHLATAPFGAHSAGRTSTLFPLDKEPQPQINDSLSPSIGPAAAQALDVEPERETWRKTARDWYALVLKEMPGQGRVHHHLAVVSREGEDEEMRAVYHFVKSTMTSTTFLTSRESVLVMFTATAQAKRMQPDARTADLFLLLHGMLFTHIQLDDFAPTHARFIERLALEGAEEREWIMMALINIGALFEYGRHDGALRNATATATLGGRGTTTMEKRITAVVTRTDGLKIEDSTEDDKKMDVDDEEKKSDSENHTPRNESSDSPELSHSFNLALDLTFGILSYALRNPWRKINAFAEPSLNPYIPIILTFLSTLVKHPAEIALLERAIPWDDLTTFLNSVPRGIIHTETEHFAKTLTQSCSPLPEDWCMRGTEWMRRVYDRGFWKTEAGGGEVEVLDSSEESADAVSDGIIEDDGVELSHRPSSSKLRWVRCFRTGLQLTRAVEGLRFEKTEKRWSIEGSLREKLEMWKEMERREREEEGARRVRIRKWDDDMDVDDAEEEVDEEGDSYDEEDSEQVQQLKALRRHYRSLLQAQNQTSSRKRRMSGPMSGRHTRIPLCVIAGYSVLVVDTNILLSSLDMFSALVDSLKWTIIVPLAVVTELDGLSSNDSPLGVVANAAITYLTSHLRTHSLSLKVQTSRGNYLSSLNVRREQVDLRNELSWERNMDDLILRAAIWHDEHWVDRSALFKVDTGKPESVARAAKVVLLTFDRNLRVKARSRQLNAADEKDMATILNVGT